MHLSSPNCLLNKRETSRQQKLMAWSSVEDDDLVVLVCKNPGLVRTGTSNEAAILISTNDISSWDFACISRFQTLNIEAHRSRLIEQSSYFRGLLARNFSESYLKYVSIDWDFETVLNVLKCLYGCPLDLNSKNFLHLFEAALYFGVEKLLLLCQSWFSEVSSSEDPELLDIQLDDFISIWNFGIEHENDFLRGLCVSYLARNFRFILEKEAGLKDLLAHQTTAKSHSYYVDREAHQESKGIY